MGSRMDKYKNIDNIPSRSDKNKELYKQVYNAYDEFENLIVPPNSREINPNDLKKEITSRSDYKKQKDFNEITNNRIIRKEKMQEEQKKENEVYDINELLNKAIEEKKQPIVLNNNLSEDYLKKLNLDNRKTNIEQVKELYEDIQEDDSLEDESLMKTANLSLEILSDLKGDSDKTMVTAPIKTEEIPDNEADFYSNKYKFSKKDFENKDEYDDNEEDEDNEEDDDENQHSNGRFFFKILLLIFGVLLAILVLLYFINYFNRV